MTRIHQQLRRCVVSSDCLECPLPLCKHDGEAGQAVYQAWLRERETSSTKKMLLAGESTREIAQATGVTLRTVFRRKAKMAS